MSLSSQPNRFGAVTTLHRRNRLIHPVLNPISVGFLHLRRHATGRWSLGSCFSILVPGLSPNGCSRLTELHPVASLCQELVSLTTLGSGQTGSGSSRGLKMIHGVFVLAAQIQFTARFVVLTGRLTSSRMNTILATFQCVIRILKVGKS